MLIAQITDMHIREPGTLAYRRVDTAAHLERCIAQVMRLDPLPDVVLVTGDLTDKGRPEEYRHLRTLLAPLTMPVYVIPGNHDERGALRDAFRDHDYLPQDGEFLHYAIDQYPLRLIGLDTVVPGLGGGMLCDERLRWLEARLAETPEKPTVIFMHHPPFKTGIAIMDFIGLADADAFGEIVAKHPQVERILCGHLHRAIQARFRGTLASTCPGSAHQVELELRPNTAAGFVMEPPGFQLHHWDGAQLVSHTAVVGDFDGPHSFIAAGRLVE
jgi:3',5'-cyclic AMP phosphodiesterase CpdA